MRDKYRDIRDTQRQRFMNTDTKTPADRILAQFGASKLAAWTQRHRSRVHAWTWPAEKGGTGGVVPPRLRPAIIEGARAEGVDIAHADFEPQDGERYLFGASA